MSLCSRVFTSGKMANRIFLLCLLVSCLTVSYIECRSGGRSSGRSGGRSRGSSSSSWGKSWGSSSGSSKPSWSSSYNKPSSSWGSSSSSHGYPSSSSGLSGPGSSSHGYPSSSSGLSGSGSSGSSWWNFGSSSGSSKYPSSSSGLSGSGSSSHGYPSSSSGLSGSGSSGSSWWNFGSSSGSSKYPSSSSGLSGSSSGSSKYPISGSGLSGSGPGYKPSSSSGSHTYPSSSSGISGSQSSYGTNNYRPSYDTSYKPSHTYNTNTGHSTSYNHGTQYYGSPSVPYAVPSYYSGPQYVYVNEYRHSDSRYGDLLTGLTLYNLGRSHSHYHNDYYNDDYRRRYDTSRNTYVPENTYKQANCLLKVKENEKVEMLKIPCEIVSTFTQGSKKVAPTEHTRVNQTVCTTTTTIMNNSAPVTTAAPPTSVLSVLPVNSSSVNSTESPKTNYAMLANGTLVTLPETTTATPAINSTLTVNGSSSNTTVTSVKSNTTMVNVTVCTTNSTVVDPLTVKGPPVNAKNMECSVEIRTKESFMHNTIDCNTLIAYAKMPEPKKDTGILPPKEKLKSWLSNPPWWMSIFIAV